MSDYQFRSGQPIRILPPKARWDYVTHFYPAEYKCRGERCVLCQHTANPSNIKLTNSSDPGKVQDMNKAKLELGQIRRWTRPGLSEYTWKVVALPGQPNPDGFSVAATGCYRRRETDVLGQYLKPSEHFLATRDAGVHFTAADLQFVEDNSDLAEELYLDVDVTQEDIDQGVCGSFAKCAISRAAERAVKRRFRRWKGVTVSTGVGLGVKTNESLVKMKIWTRLPDMAAKFIGHYDSPDGKKNAKPFKFRVVLPEKFVGRPRRAA